MLDSILALIGTMILIYVVWTLRTLTKERKKRIEELKLVYSRGLKEYNKSLAKELNQTPSTFPSA